MKSSKSKKTFLFFEGKMKPLERRSKKRLVVLMNFLLFPFDFIDFKKGKPFFQKSPFELQKEIRLAGFLFVFSMVLICCAPVPSPQKASPPPLVQKRSDYLYILDDNASCEIPDSAEVVHLPQMHELSSIFEFSLPENTMNFLEESATQSQFLLTKIMAKERFKVVFNEGSKDIITREDMDEYSIGFELTNQQGETRPLSYKHIPLIFDEGVQPHYNHLTLLQKFILLRGGAVRVSFGLNHIETIHRVMTFSEAAELHSQAKSLVKDQTEAEREIKTLIKNKEKAHPKEMSEELKKWSDLNRKFNKLALEDRDQILSREVRSFLDKTQKTLPAIIVYGAAHDFSDDFKNYNFYILPHVCTLPSDYLKSPFYAQFLRDMAFQIQTHFLQ